jgi:hypothetical protein
MMKSSELTAELRMLVNEIIVSSLRAIQNYKSIDTPYSGMFTIQ